ncbi:MAG: histidinol-phosphatase HisJ family protein [Desulfitobacterium sp.]|nr:histidinol-phosphatase HisJ family protein [Desulfitobacterium sp.]
MYLFDYHTHTLNSLDGHDDIFALCENAIAQGLREITITDHFESSLGNDQYLRYNAKETFSQISEARQKFEGKLIIKAGVELGQPHLFPEYSLKLIENHPYDYVLGSAHRMPDSVDFGEVEYTAENLSSYCLKYLDVVKGLAQWNHFDCVGHFDLVKRYAANYQLKAQLLDYKERVAEILKILIQNGKGIEVNTSGLRQSSGECLPDFDIIRFYRQLGGEIITVGSDAHWASDIAKGIEDAIEIIHNAGFRYLTIYTNRKPRMVKISNQAVILSIGAK